MGSRRHTPALRRIAAGLVAGLAAGLAFASCSAEGVKAPDLDEKDRPRPSECRSMRSLMPNFFRMLEEPASPLTGLHDVVVKMSEGDAASNPLAAVLGGTLRGLKNFTNDPPESSDQECLSQAPTAGVAVALPLCTVEAGQGEACENRMCAVKRALDFGVRDREAVDALHALRPLLVKVLGYVSNHGPGADGKEHLQAIEVLHRTSAAEYAGICAPENLITVLDATLTYLRANADCAKTHSCVGQKLLTLMKGLLEDKALSDFLSGYESSQADGKGRAAFQKLAGILMSNLGSLRGDADPYEVAIKPLVDTIKNFLDRDPDKYGKLKAEVEQLETLLKTMLSTADATPEKKARVAALASVANCLAVADKDQEVVGDLYDLLSRPGGDQGAGLDLKELVAALDGVSQADDTGIIVGVLHVVFASMLKDEQSMENVRALLNEMLTVENARASLPALQAMVDEGVIDEIVTVLDNLVYGCKADPAP